NSLNSKPHPTVKHHDRHLSGIEVNTMNIPIPAETPDPNIDNPALPVPPPAEEPPPTMPPVIQPPAGDPPPQEPPVIVMDDLPK
ncbi:hypothetical protein K5D51_14935, partial [Pseudomonas cichorii]|nr:hypothetical protein [Pseudomonas cichorii]